MEFLKANYHAHTWRCQHAYDTEREYIEAAISMGIEIFGFSDHVPCPYQDGYVSNIRMTMKQAPEYVETIRRLEAEYRDQIKIYAGFEAEYVPEFYEEQMRMFRNLGCDYMIMGQHFLESEENGPNPFPDNSSDPDGQDTHSFRSASLRLRDPHICGYGFHPPSLSLYTVRFLPIPENAAP